jgi:hypothetical protein
MKLSFIDSACSVLFETSIVNISKDEEKIDEEKCGIKQKNT